MKLTLLRKTLYVVSWIPQTILMLMLMALGLVTVPLALGARCLTFEFRDPPEDFWPDIFWLWGNEEDTPPPKWWQAKAAQSSWFVRTFPNFWWYAIRNPVNNFRFLFDDREANWSGNWVSEHMEAREMLENNCKFAYRWAYNGLFAGFRCVYLHGYRETPVDLGDEEQGVSWAVASEADSYTEFWWGWKVGSTVPGMDFTMQFRWKREIGQ